MRWTSLVPALTISVAMIVTNNCVGAATMISNNCSFPVVCGTSPSFSTLSAFGSSYSMDNSASAVANVVYTQQQFLSGYGSAWVTTSYDLITAGPIRPGFLVAQVSGSADGSGIGGASANLSVGNYSCGYSGSRTSCIFQSPQLRFDGYGAMVVPFMLGTPFTYSLSAEASGSSANYASGSARISVSLSFHEQELWGSYYQPAAASVEIFDQAAVPEPASLVLCASGFSGLVLLAAVKRKRAGRAQ